MAVVKALAEKRGFTHSQAELADYVLAHADEVTHMSIRDLTHATYKSNDTVIQLCHKVGSDGWRAFRVDLAADLARLDHARTVETDILLDSSIGVRDVMDAIAQLESEAVEDCREWIDANQVTAFAKAVLDARVVYFYARGNSYGSVSSFAIMTSKVGVTCIPVDQYHLFDVHTFRATADDLVIFVSYGGHALDDVVLQLEELRARRCKLAIVTSSIEATKRFGEFDYSVLVPRRETKQGKPSSCYAQTCLRYALDCVSATASVLRSRKLHAEGEILGVL